MYVLFATSKTKSCSFLTPGCSQGFNCIDVTKLNPSDHRLCSMRSVLYSACKMGSPQERAVLKRMRIPSFFVLKLK